MKVSNNTDIKKIVKPSDIYEIMKPIYKQNDEIDKDREQLYLICLDTRQNVLSIDLISMGTINEALISPREVYRTALIKNAVSIILIHNHPSGDCMPSNEDITVTNAINKAGKLIGVKLLDHVIYTEDDYLSIRATNKYFNTKTGEVTTQVPLLAVKDYKPLDSKEHNFKQCIACLKAYDVTTNYQEIKDGSEYVCNECWKVTQ